MLMSLVAIPRTITLTVRSDFFQMALPLLPVILLLLDPFLLQLLHFLLMLRVFGSMAKVGEKALRLQLAFMRHSGFTGRLFVFTGIHD